MVNLIDNFTKLYNRPPTQSEVVKMMEMQAEQDAFRNKKNTALKREVVKAQPDAKPKRTRVRKKVAPKVLRINKMMFYGLTIEQIADVLEAKISNIEWNIKRHELPSEHLALIDYSKCGQKVP